MGEEEEEEVGVGIRYDLTCDGADDIDE